MLLGAGAVWVGLLGLRIVVVKILRVALHSQVVALVVVQQLLLGVLLREGAVGVRVVHATHVVIIIAIPVVLVALSLLRATITVAIVAIATIISAIVSMAVLNHSTKGAQVAAFLAICKQVSPPDELSLVVQIVQIEVCEYGLAQFLAMQHNIPFALPLFLYHTLIDARALEFLHQFPMKPLIVFWKN